MESNGKGAMTENERWLIITALHVFADVRRKDAEDFGESHPGMRDAAIGNARDAIALADRLEDYR